jgi:hypothetical protein
MKVRCQLLGFPAGWAVRYAVSRSVPKWFGESHLACEVQFVCKFAALACERPILFT